MAAKVEKRKYLELADHLRERIHSGELKVGERLPSYVDLYQERGVSTATVQRACDVLDQEKLIERRNGSGIFVAAPRRTLSGTIGIIGSGSFKAQDSPFYKQVMDAVHNVVESQQQHSMYLGTEAAVNAAAVAKVDGVLIFGVQESAPVFKELPSSLPKVSVLNSIDGVVSVAVDEYRGAQMAVRHLMDLGHRRIACLMEKRVWPARRRFGGYCEALEERGIEINPSWARLVNPLDFTKGKIGQPYLEWGRGQMQAWLREDWEEMGCTAILVQNDVAAIGVIQVLQNAGIKVPEQVSVIGFDGTEVCDLISPRLTSVAMPLTQIGRRAVALLNRQIAGKTVSPETILLPLSLRSGESVAPAIAN